MLIEKQMPMGYMIQKIKYDMFYVLLIGIITEYLTTKFKHLIPEMPMPIPAFLGTSISVLLSFKLNQSYDRWWEARKIWGSIVNDSRTLVIQLQSFVKKGNDGVINSIALRQIAWCYCLGQSLRDQDAMKNMEKYLSLEDQNYIEKHQNKPLAILQLNALQITELKNNNQLELFAQTQINTTLVGFSNSMGMAERIKKTIFPVTYKHFLHWVIYIFLITLSIALGDIDSLFEVPLLMVIASAFFLLEKASSSMQDPFQNEPSDTAMTTISNTIEINIKQLIGDKNIPEPYLPEKFYAM